MTKNVRKLWERSKETGCLVHQRHLVERDPPAFGRAWKCGCYKGAGISNPDCVCQKRCNCSVCRPNGIDIPRKPVTAHFSVKEWIGNDYYTRRDKADYWFDDEQVRDYYCLKCYKETGIAYNLWYVVNQKCVACSRRLTHGLKRKQVETYMPKNPCKRCGTSLRYVSSRACIQCSRTHSRRESGQKIQPLIASETEILLGTERALVLEADGWTWVKRQPNPLLDELGYPVFDAEGKLCYPEEVVKPLVVKQPLAENETAVPGASVATPAEENSESVWNLDVYAELGINIKGENE